MMRSTNPARGHGAWPAEMSLSMDDHAQPIRMLLFIRQAWGLAEDLALPELSPVPGTGASAMPDEADRHLWEQRWIRTWSNAWAGKAHGPHRVPGLAAMTAAAGPIGDNDFWTHQYGDEGIDRLAFEQWEQMFDPLLGLDLGPVLQSPRVEPVLVAAWERGLADLTVVPWAGYCMHRLGDSHLVTSFETAASWSLLRQALAEWIRTPLG
ncbi:hypothetical protein [Glutamicibacter soli]|uniref:Uncharacterized protein n=1 Tax=Glutamicibacter soli TaxID=453836 RepID=A0A6L9G9H9_9MICC|nr:hypothetical protein [Glutamicibacter soli]NAZ17769.1 hypothetical protein [Glutamicibacter soli]